MCSDVTQTCPDDGGSRILTSTSRPDYMKSHLDDEILSTFISPPPPQWLNLIQSIFDSSQNLLSDSSSESYKQRVRNSREEAVLEISESQKLQKHKYTYIHNAVLWNMRPCSLIHKLP